MVEKKFHVFFGGERKSFSGKEGKFFQEIIERMSGGVRISVVNATELFDALKILSQNKERLEEFKKSIGAIATYCIGGKYRSAVLGELFSKLGFIFAQPETVRGARVGKIIDSFQKITLKENGLYPEGAKSVIETLILAINISDPSELEIVEILLENIKLKVDGTKERFSLNLLIIDSTDFNGGYEQLRKLAQEYFPDFNLQGFSKPW